MTPLPSEHTIQTLASQKKQESSVGQYGDLRTRWEAPNTYRCELADNRDHMTNIYRFETLNYFEEAMHDKALTFVSPYKWDDWREGLLFRATFSYDGTKEVKDAASEMFKHSDLGEDFVTTLELLLRHLRMTRLAQCWSKCQGNSTLWIKKDVRIETSRADISRLNGVTIRDVVYLDSVGIEDGLKRLNPERAAEGGTHLDMDSVLSVKHKDYSDEYEVRLLTVEGENTNRDYPDNILFAQVFVQLRRQGKMSKEDFESNISHLRIIDKKKVPFGHTEDFIKSVMLHNSASTEVEKKVQRLCEERSLKYLGRFQPNVL